MSPLGLIFVKEITMRKLTQQEHKIYSDYITTELLKEFEQYGKITIDDFQQLIYINYEISEITDNIYPILEFSSDYNNIKNITKFNMNTHPNNLLDEYQIKTIDIPSVYLYTGRFTGRITPYMMSGKDIYDHYLLPYGLTQCFEIEYIPKTILTNGKTKYFNFIISSTNNHRISDNTTDYELPINYLKIILTNVKTKYFNFIKSSTSNHRISDNTTDYELPINYSSEKSDSISELRDDITNKLEQSLAQIKPIDINHLQEIINAHYNTR